MGQIGPVCWLVTLKFSDDFFYLGEEFQKSAIPTLFHFAGVRVAYQPQVLFTTFSKDFKELIYLNFLLRLLLKITERRLFSGYIKLILIQLV